MNVAHDQLKKWLTDTVHQFWVVVINDNVDSNSGVANSHSKLLISSPTVKTFTNGSVF